MLESRGVEMTRREKGGRQGNRKRKKVEKTRGKTRTDQGRRWSRNREELLSSVNACHWSHQDPFFLSSRKFNPRTKAANTCPTSSPRLNTSFLRCIVFWCFNYHRQFFDYFSWLNFYLDSKDNFLKKGRDKFDLWFFALIYQCMNKKS